MFISGMASSLMPTTSSLSGRSDPRHLGVAHCQLPKVASQLVGSAHLGRWAIVFGRVADRLGRRKIYGFEVLVLAAGALASASAPGIWWLIGFRAILGFGIGGDYPVSATL